MKALELLNQYFSFVHVSELFNNAAHNNYELKFCFRVDNCGEYSLKSLNKKRNMNESLDKFTNKF